MTKRKHDPTRVLARRGLLISATRACSDRPGKQQMANAVGVAVPLTPTSERQTVYKLFINSSLFAANGTEGSMERGQTVYKQFCVRCERNV